MHALGSTSSAPTSSGTPWTDTPPRRSPQGTRTLLLAGAATIAALQLIDAYTTHQLIRAGHHELNPLAGILLVAGWLLAVKALLAAGLLARVGQRPRPALVPAVFFTAGLYAAVALGNTLALLR